MEGAPAMREKISDSQFESGEWPTTSRRCLFTFLSLFFFAPLVGAVFAQVVIPVANDINTVAGTGTAGFTGDGGLATSADWNVAFDCGIRPSL